MSTKPDIDTGWSKEFPQVEGFYFARRTQTNAPGLTVIQVWEYEGEWFAYRFANQDDIEAKDFIRSLYEYLGPMSPSDFEQLIRLRKAAGDLLAAMDQLPMRFGSTEQSVAALREALAHKGEQS